MLPIAAAVLVPFAALVAFGFWQLKNSPTVVQPPTALGIEPSPRPAPAPVALPKPQGIETQPPRPEVFSLTRVEPLVHQCFQDVAGRVREPIEVTVSFDTTAEGGFERVVIDKTSWQDPHLMACILDSFEDAPIDRKNLLQGRQTHTFTFNRPDAGR